MAGILTETEPSWLDAFLEQVSDMPEKSQLIEERTQSRYAELPWPYFLEDKLLNMGVSSSILLDSLVRKFPTLQPVSLDYFEKGDFSDRFPGELIKKYHVVPFNLEAPFLSVAAVDPDLLAPFHKNYVEWVKTSTFSLLQLFVVLPSSFDSYLAK